MSGHSKWSTIKHKKALTDSKKGKEFSKLARLITVCVKEKGADPEMNINLRMAILKAREANMPSENIKRAIQKGEGGKEGTGFENVTYEIYGPSGAAMVVFGLTDNKNRTTAEIRNILVKNGARLGEDGSVLWMFEKKGVISINLKNNQKKENEIELIGIDAGVEDMKTSSNVIEFFCQTNKMKEISDKLLKNQITIKSLENKMIAKNMVTLAKEEKDKVLRLTESLENYDDVDMVFHNVK